MLGLSDIVDIEDGQTFFGRVLGSGCYSIAIKVSNPYVCSNVSDLLEDPVLIITTEKEKIEIMKELFGEESVISIDLEKKYNLAKENWLDMSEFETEEEANLECYEFDYLVECNEFDLYNLFEKIAEKDLFCFYMEACEDVKSSEAKMIGFLFDELGHCEFNTSFFEDFSTGLDIDDVANYINDYKSFLPDEDLSSVTFLDKVFNLLQVTERDIQKAAKRLSKSLSDIPSLALDIHSEQFLKFKGEIVCSDPFTFDM